MPSGLPVSRVISTTYSLTPPVASYENFDTLLIVGDSPVIDTYERVREYSSIQGLLEDFTSTDPEYLAADIFFSQSPSPTTLFVGRWASQPTAARLVCGLLSTTAQAIGNWTTVTNGSFTVSIDGSPFNITGLNFSIETNLNGVASAIQTAIRAAGVAPPAAPTLTAASGGSLSAGTVYVKTTLVTAFGESLPSTEANVAVAASDLVNVPSPTGVGTEVIGYNVYASTTTGTEEKQNSAPISIGTAYQILTIITGASPPVTNTAYTVGSQTATVVWTAENYFQFQSGQTGPTSLLSYLSAISPAIGTDISTQLLGTATTAQYVVDGIAAETAATAATVFLDGNTQWYGMTFATANGNANFSDSDALAIAALIEATGGSSNGAHIFGVTTSEPGAVSSVTNTDLGAELMVAQYTRTFAQYSTQSPFACCAIFGLLFTVNFQGSNTMIDVMWKSIAGVTSETLTVSQASALDGKRYNYYALFTNGNSIVVNGTMAYSYYIDEIFGLDAFVNAVQTDIWNLFAGTPTKIPQTDPGIHQIVLTIEGTCQTFVNNGFFAPGVWNSAGFGPLTPGYTLSKGYLVYAPPVSTQSAASRALRQTPLIQCAAKEAGAVNDVLLSIGINR